MPVPHFGRAVCTGLAYGASWSWVISPSARNCLAVRMKILRSIHSLNPAIRGPMEAVREASAILANRGHQVEIVSLDAPGDPWLREFPVPARSEERRGGDEGG